MVSDNISELPKTNSGQEKSNLWLIIFGTDDNLQWIRTDPQLFLKNW